MDFQVAELQHSLTVDNLKRENDQQENDRLDTFFKLSDGSFSYNKEAERDVDGRDWTAMHFKKRTEKPKDSPGRQR